LTVVVERDRFLALVWLESGTPTKKTVPSSVHLDGALIDPEPPSPFDHGYLLGVALDQLCHLGRFGASGRLVLGFELRPSWN
jgi:hypothetical protein